MKAPQDCTGTNPKLEAKKSKKKKKVGADEEGEGDGEPTDRNGSLKRMSTAFGITSVVTPTESGAATPRRTETIGSTKKVVKHISAAPPPAKYVSAPPPRETSGGGGGSESGKGQQKAKALYQYDATSPDELSIKPSDNLTVIEPDDGSGWIVAKLGSKQGIVPAAYVEMAAETKKGPPVPRRRGGKKTGEEPKKKYFKVMYDYDAHSELELSIKEGDLVKMVSEDKGDGWTEVEMNGKVGSVPSNYIEAVEK